MENNYYETSKYIYILINNDTLTFVTNKQEQLAATIIDIKKNFGNSIFPNIEVE